MNKSTKGCSGSIERLKQALENCDSLVIGAGAGLSASAGFSYSGERFRRYFADFEKKYGFHDMYSGGFYPYATRQEFWAYWSRYILVNRYQDPPRPVYQTLLSLVREKDYFVITTNVDHCFQKAGFEKDRLFSRRAITGCFSAACPAMTAPMIMKSRCAPWRRGSGICASPMSCCPFALSAAGRWP